MSARALLLAAALALPAAAMAQDAPLLAPLADDMGARSAAQTRLPHLAPGVELGYTLEERALWLADCRMAMVGGPAPRSFGRHEGGDSDLVGGVLGAIVGGVAGNRIADGDRLAGTLVGAGLGGLAGALIGGLIDRDNDREARALAEWEAAEWARMEDWAADYCDAYLRRYESAGFAASAWSAQPATVMVQTLAPRREVRRIVRRVSAASPAEIAAEASEAAWREAEAETGKNLPLD